jgi:hypothetical protein
LETEPRKFKKWNVLCLPEQAHCTLPHRLLTAAQNGNSSEANTH